jgi:thiol-disulfide isomerase/thioredoxin
LLRTARFAALAVLLAASADATAARPSDAVLQTLDGAPVALPDDRVVLLQFWASWCNSCGGLLWDIDRLLAGFPSLDYLAVSIDAELVDARRIVAHPLHARAPTRFAHDAAGDLQRAFDIRVSPSLLLLDADGAVLWRHVGHVNADDLQRLRSILDTVHPPPARRDSP